MAAQLRHLHRLLAFFDPLLRRASLVVETDHSPTVRPRLVTMNRTRENISPNWNSTFTTTGRAVFQLAVWYRSPLYLTTGFWLGLPTGPGNNSTMSRSTLSFAGMRIAHCTSRSSSAS